MSTPHSRERRHPVEQLVERDRVVAHAHAGGVADRIRNRRADTAQTQFPDALGLHR
jgi:hypothetical protein